MALLAASGTGHPAGPDRRDVAPTYSRGGAGATLPKHVPGEVLLRFSADATADQRAAVLDGLGDALPKRIGSRSDSLVRLRGLTVAEAVEGYGRAPGVAILEPNYIISKQVTPDDPGFPLQWSLFNNGQTGGTVRADIQAREAWDVLTGSTDVLVAVLDSGIDLTHPDLAGQVYANPDEIPDNGVDDDDNGFVDDVHGWNFVERNNDPFDDSGHGTHVSGIVGAAGNNGEGIAGVAWQVRILPVRFLNQGGFGTTAQAVEAIDYAVLMGARLINASWGNFGFSFSLRDAIERAGDSDILFVAASGNANPALDLDHVEFFPASFRLDNIIRVAATDHDDNVWVFSNFGDQFVDMAAPGVDVFSTLPGGSYGHASGTSMAAPHVTGTLALIYSRFPDLTGANAKALLLARTDTVPQLDEAVIGGRRLNALLPIAFDDDVPPAAITTLQIVEIDGERMDVEWVAPGDDGNDGTANRYEVRHSTTPLDEASFANATLVAGIPVPSPAGSVERMRIAGLTFDTRYYVAVRALDEIGNAGPISNVATAVTRSPPRIVLEPDRLTDVLDAGTVADHGVRVVNAGDSDYVYEVLVRRPGSEVAGRIGQAAPDAPRAAPGPGLVEPSALAPPGRAAGAPEGLRILFLRSGVLGGSIVEQVAAFPEVAVADVVDGTVASPRLQKLLEYDAVILVVDLPSGDRIGIGNDLAAFVDAGGGLVATLATFVEGFHLEGRLADEGYLPFARGGPGGGFDVLGAFDDTHPIMHGVSDAGSSLIAILQLADGAERVASWSSGLPFIATKGNVVGINALLVQDAFWSGDMPTILVNAAFWASGAVNWLSTEPASGVIPAGQEANLTVRFDATHLIEGDYEADLVLRGNDPRQPESSVRAELEVRGTPALQLTDGFDFGSVFVGGSAELELVLENVGTADLSIEAVTVDDGNFAVDVPATVLLPRHALSFPVRFAPQAPGGHSATLTVASNDPAAPLATATLAGEGVAPPAITVAPASIHVALEVGEQTTRTLTLDNPGDATLEYELRLRRDEATFTFEETFEDGVLDGWQSGGITDNEVTDATAAAGSRFSYHERFALFGHFNGLYRNFDAIRPGYIGMHVRSGETERDDAYFVLRDSAGNDVIWFYAKHTGMLYCNANTGGDETFAYDPEVWYHIEFRDINFANKTFDYWVDGELIRADVDFRTPAEAIDRLDMYGLFSGTRSWWDEIYISSHPPVETVRADRRSGSLAAGGSDTISVELDARRVFGGEYRSSLSIATNVPTNREVVVPVTVDVTGTPVVLMTPESVDFGQVFVGLEEARVLIVANNGSDDLVVERVDVDAPGFSSDATGFVLRPGEARPLTVTFHPTAAGPVDGTLRLVSGPADGVAEVALSGEGLLAPSAELAPDGVQATLAAGSTTGRTVTLTNAGGLPLVYRLFATDPFGLPLEASVATFADDGDPGVAGWTTEVYGGADLWHRTTRDSHGPGTSWWCGVEATGGYDTGERVGTALVSPPLDLRELQAPVALRFAERYETEPVFDACMVDVSDDGGRNWAPLRGEYGQAPAGSSGGWRQRFLNLSPYIGQIVRVRFYFETFDGLNNLGAGWFVDDVRVVGAIDPWLEFEPREGTLEAGSSLVAPLHLAAPTIAATDRYTARLVARTNDPFVPETSVPVYLDVTGHPRIALPGPTVTVAAEATFTDARATLLQVPVASHPGGGELIVEVHGDLSGPERNTTVSAEADVLGMVHGEEGACTVSVARFDLPGALLADLAADGAIDLELRNAAAVAPDCESNRHIVSLSYAAPLEVLDLGTADLGEGVTRTLTVLNTGTAPLTVAEIGSDLPGLAVHPGSANVAAGATAVFEVRFDPATTGTLTGSLTLDSDDPDRPRVVVPVTGEVRAAALVAVTPAALTAALPPRSDRTHTRIVELHSLGAVPLEWTAEVPAGIAVAPVNGTVEPGETALVAVTFSATDLDAAQHVSTLILHTNTAVGRVEVPLILNVGEVELSRLAFDFTPRTAPGSDVVEIAIELPDDLDPSEILLDSIGLNECLDPAATFGAMIDLDLDGTDELLVHIDLETFEECMPRPDAAGIRSATVVGEVHDRTWFTGTRYLRGIVQLP